MKYQLGDKFIIRGIACEVRIINAGKAWVFPIQDIYNGPKSYLACTALDVLDEKGHDNQGNRVYHVVNRESMAV